MVPAFEVPSRERSIAAARHTLDEVDGAAPDGPVTDADLSHVTSAVAIVASSRGGSSLLHQILSDQPDVLSIAGEHTALYKLNRLDRGRDGSDVLEPDVAFDWTAFSRDFMSLLGSGPARPPSAPRTGSCTRPQRRGVSPCSGRWRKSRTRACGRPSTTPLGRVHDPTSRTHCSRRSCTTSA